MKKRILTIIIVALALNLIVSYFFKSPDSQNQANNNQIILSSNKKEFGLDDAVSAEIKNETPYSITIKNRCPSEPVEVLFYRNGQWTPKTNAAAMINCAETTDVIIPAGEKHTFLYNSWNHALFGEMGRYKLRTSVISDITAPIAANPAMPVQPTKTSEQVPAANLSQTQTQSQQTTQAVQNQVQPNTESGFIQIQPPSTQIIESPEFEVKSQGILSYLWTLLFYQPLYNILIFLINIAPGKDLGLGIILLTVIIRTVLLVPSQNALKSQRKMQEIQPKLNKIKEKYKDNQEMIAKETMAVWKEHKASPLGSCLPLLIQFPVLIALFHVVQNGLNPDNSYLLYPFLKNFSFENINVMFLNILDLTKVNRYVLPLIVGGLQFLQLKLASVNQKSKTPAKDEKAGKKAPKTTKSEMEIATNSMMYVMPVMIIIFAASVPAGVSIYWCVSTIYGIAQQMVVNRQGKKEKATLKILDGAKKS